ncbi:NfeD family protein [Sinimarinibacterium sp. CAU 1509]|uniref:NfeD family protein n=1 Tax=Sinimarinibacterium sp. CAU 1509 TaxID=2562283 RepID=UPI001B7FD93B|nr:nodulation protein NfeD [Sinimarinibacterium sp. CAU 1509]
MRWLTLIGLLLAASSVAAGDAYVAEISIEGAIGPATSAHVEKAMTQAQDSGATAIVLRIDTPGGLDSAMRDIIKRVLASPVPVIGWVGPSGARAASAGTYILYATHIAAMAPATNLGAATPIPVGGSWPLPDSATPASPRDNDPERKPDAASAADEATTSDPSTGETRAVPRDAATTKAINDAVAYIRGLAEQRGRNADWAESAVRNGASLSAQQALNEQVIDLVADDVHTLLRAVDGRTVSTATGEQTLQTADLRVETLEPDWRIKLLATLTNPTVAYMLMLIGIYGLLLEGYHPGAILPGVTGGISLLLALYAFQLLPVNYVGLALMALGVALMVTETMAPSFGVLGIGGTVAFVLGSVLLMDVDVPGYGINVGVIVGIAVSAAVVMALTLYLLWRARHARVVTGGEAMLGETVDVLEFADGEGWGEIGGERWHICAQHTLHPGQRARVTGRHGLRLDVEPIN